MFFPELAEDLGEQTGRTMKTGCGSGHFYSDQMYDNQANFEANKFRSKSGKR